jgi:hypothetical protein
MTEGLPLLAHAGPGSTWQAMLVVVALGLVVVVVLAILGRVVIDRLDDLVLPVAAVAIVSSLAPLGDEWLSDWIGWAFPVGVVMLVALVLAAVTPLELAPDGLLVYAAAGLAVAGAVVLHQPLTIAWHPPPELLPDRGDAQITIVEPEDGAVVAAGETPVVVRVDGGSIRGERVPFEDLGADPEEAGALDVTVDGERVEVGLEQTCTGEEPCTEVSFPVDLPEGEVRLRVEFTRGDGMPFAPTNTTGVDLTVE